jgi:hypothetical protein
MNSVDLLDEIDDYRKDFLTISPDLLDKIINDYVQDTYGSRLVQLESRNNDLVAQLEPL